LNGNRSEIFLNNSWKIFCKFWRVKKSHFKIHLWLKGKNFPQKQTFSFFCDSSKDNSIFYGSLKPLEGKFWIRSTSFCCSKNSQKSLIKFWEKKINKKEGEKKSQKFFQKLKIFFGVYFSFKILFEKSRLFISFYGCF